MTFFKDQKLLIILLDLSVFHFFAVYKVSRFKGSSLKSVIICLGNIDNQLRSIPEDLDMELIIFQVFLFNNSRMAKFTFKN